MSEIGSLDIAVIGGSLSGCMAAILLTNAGHRVKVYERSRRGLLGRGGGLTSSRRILTELKSNNLIDQDFPASPFDTLKMAKWSDEDPNLGRTALSRPIDMHCVNWGGFWENLRKQVPDELYHQGYALSNAVEANEAVELEFENGHTCRADLLLFADGYQSFGRKLLFPDIELSYRGYSVWRGVLPDSEVEDHSPLKNHPRYSFRTMPGSFVSFVIPASNGSTIAGERVINWAAYIPVPESELESFMLDDEGNSRVGTIPTGSMRQQQDQDLKALMEYQLPAYYSRILSASNGNQLQNIYTCALPAYRKGRMCLIGDAGMMVQPMTGSGVFKGYSNSRDLAQVLRNYADLDDALESWSIRQTYVGHRMLQAGREMEEAFIWKTPDLATIEPEAAEVWWNEHITIPDEFSYLVRPN